MDVGAGSAGAADKPIPSAIFVVNFDKVRLAVLFFLLKSCTCYAECPTYLIVLVFVFVWKKLQAFLVYNPRIPHCS